ncbi:hypothetical protein BRC82_02880 [Halobacteriales archaeon QS_1_67_19]|nr:MAG: hypothetical protein BRC82_02880 [Halobacteriales archaeon QS_1_67_19]
MAGLSNQVSGTQADRSITPLMNRKHTPHASTPTTFGDGRAPRTPGGLAAYAGFAALILLTLFALAHPAVVAAAAFGLVAGLLMRPLRRRLARRRGRRRPQHGDRPTNAYAPTATNE